MEQYTESSRRRTGHPALVAVLLLLVAVAASGCGGSGDESRDRSEAPEPAGRRAEVTIASFNFVPEDARVQRGGTVTWVNEDSAPHTAQTDTDDAPEPFDTGTLRLNESKAIKFDVPGTYEYLCGFHMFMVGTVEVVD